MQIVAFTGAGISKSAGIPTFEEVEGLKEKLSVDFKESHPQEFEDAINQLKNSVKDKEPTIAHKALADLQIPIITMNVDCLHKKAGSRLVYQIHGDYKSDNIVLYGQDLLFKDESVALIVQTAKQAKMLGEDAVFLVIGTSMQTVFANVLVWFAQDNGMKVHYINENADEEVPKFLKEHVFLKR